MPDGEQRIDPRYDPVYQRGFDAAGRPLAPPASAAPPPATAPNAPAIAPLRAPEHHVVRHDPAVDEVHEALDTADGPRRARPPVWRNPYLLALVVVGVGLILGGITTARLVAERQRTGVSVFDDAYLAFVLLQFGAPLLIALGVATLIGVLFILAIEHQRR